MKKPFKIMLVISACIVFLGSHLTLLALGLRIIYDYQMTGAIYSAKSYSQNALFIEEIDLSTISANVIVENTQGDELCFEYYKSKTKSGRVSRYYKIDLTDGILTLKEHESLISVFDFPSKTPVVTLKIPFGKKVALSVKAGKGKVTLGQESESLELRSLTVKDSNKVLVAGQIDCEQDFKVYAYNKFSAKSQINCGGKVFIETQESYIKAGVINASSIELKTDVGDILIGEYVFADVIDMTAYSGNVTITVKGEKQDYSYILNTKKGKSNITPYDGGDKTIQITVSNGNINLFFTE